MGSTEGTEQSGAGLPRRLLGGAVSVIWTVGALVLGWLIWPSSLGGCTTLTIVSGRSMEPTYYTGDLVVTRCGPVELGDVIVYNPPDVGGARVIHRIVDGNATEGWIVQGDNNDFLDPWKPTQEQILGSPVLHVPGLGTAASILLSPLTWISMLVVALAIVIWPGKDVPDDEIGDPDGQSAPPPQGEEQVDLDGPGLEATDGQEDDLLAGVGTPSPRETSHSTT